jgi:hypothetical protein
LAEDFFNQPHDKARRAIQRIERDLAFNPEEITGSEINPPNPDDFGVGKVQTFQSTLQATEVIASGLKAVDTIWDQDDWEDPDYRFDDYIATRPDNKLLIQPFLDDATLAGGQAFLSNISSAPNAKAAERIFDDYRDAQKRVQDMMDNPATAIITGLGGIGFDIAMVAVIEAYTIGMGAPAVAAMLERAQMSQKLLTAARGALVGAADATAVTAANATFDPMMSDADVIGMGLLGGLAGGGGSAFAEAFVRARKLKKFRSDRAEAEAADEAFRVIPDPVEPGLKGGGAAVSPDPLPPEGLQRVTGENVPGPGSGSVVGKIISDKSLAAYALRGGIQQMVDRGVKGAKQLAKQGLTGNSVWHNIMSRVLRKSTANIDEIDDFGQAGTRARDPEVERSLARMEQFTASRNKQSELEHSEVVEAVWGDGSSISKMGNATRKWEYTGSFPLKKYENMVAEYRAAKGDEILDDVIEEILEPAGELTPEMRAKLLAGIQKSAGKEDAYWDEWFSRGIAHGMFTEEDRIAGFTPQIYLRDLLLKNREAIEAKLMQRWSKKPSEVWVRSHAPGLLKEDETFLEFAKREPAQARTVSDEWSGGINDELIEGREIILAAQNDLVKKARTELTDDIIGRTERSKKALARKVVRLEAEREATKSKSAKAKFDDAIAKAQGEFEDTSRRLQAWNKARKSHAVNLMDKLIAESGRQGGKAARAALKAAKDGAEIKLAKVARQEARRTASQEVRDTLDKMLNGSDRLGFLPDNLASNTGRTKARTILWGHERFSPEIRAILQTNTREIRHSFTSTFGNELAWREVFQGRLDKADAITINELIKNLKVRSLAGFDEDIGKLSGTARAEVEVDKKTAGDLFDNIVKEFFIEHRIPDTPSGQQFAAATAAAQALTASMGLGAQLLSQSTDLAVQIFAARSLGRFFQSYWRSAEGKALARSMREVGEDESAMLVEGAEIAEMGKFRLFGEVDEAMNLMPHGRAKHMVAGIKNMAVVEGLLNFSTMASKFVRRVFGAQWIRDIDNDLTNFAQLSPRMKTYYATIGIDENVAAQMVVMYNKAFKMVGKSQKVRIPDRAKWMKERPDLMDRWTEAFNEAGRMSMISPTRGDRPFLTRNPMGRLALQFTSFMFAAGNRVVKPMVQSMYLHPQQMVVPAALLSGLMLSSLVSGGLRQAMKGNGEAWLASWQTPEGMRERFYEMWLRSAFMPGVSGVLFDNFARFAGPQMNDIVGSLPGGIRPFQQSPYRVRTPSVAGIVGGPFANIVGDRVIKGAQQVLGGDFESAAQTFGKSAPLLNIFYMQMLQRALDLQE